MAPTPSSLVRAMNRTLVICKPDAVERGLVGEIVGRLERKGLRLVAAELRHDRRGHRGASTTRSTGKPFYDELVGFITRSPSMVLVVEGPEDTWQHRAHADGPDRTRPRPLRGPSAAIWGRC